MNERAQIRQEIREGRLTVCVPLFSEELELITLRYFGGYSWQAVALRMHISPATAHRIDAAIIDRIIKARNE